MLIALQVMQLQELLSAARAEVQIRGSNIQILEENLAARRRRDVALTVADDEGQTVCLGGCLKKMHFFLLACSGYGVNASTS
jgi:hypothetical protein